MALSLWLLLNMDLFHVLFTVIGIKFIYRGYDLTELISYLHAERIIG